MISRRSALDADIKAGYLFDLIKQGKFYLVQALIESTWNE